MDKEQMRKMKREGEESRNEHRPDEMKRRKGRTGEKMKRRSAQPIWAPACSQLRFLVI